MLDSDNLSLLDFNYDLPEHLIAQHPAAQRTASRLLHIDNQGHFHDRQFADIVHLLRPNDLLVFNNTKVIKARLFGHKQTGGKVELLVERVLDPVTVLAHIKASKAPRAGTVLQLENAFSATVTGRQDDLFTLEFSDHVWHLLDQYGHLPLPPYITHHPDQEDDQRYQTVYADKPGAVAAPTAGLHFDQALLETLQAHQIDCGFVTLHVGAGTFQPVRVERIADHIMHAEYYEVDATIYEQIMRCRQNHGRVIAVGTTAVRALESAAAQGQYDAQHRCPQPHCDDTRLFITPGYSFKVIDGLITNFHLPQSTLLMLVASLTGLDTMKRAYQHAVQQEYRFFSYGDAMFIEPK